MQFLLIAYDRTDVGALEKMKIMKVLPINRDKLFEQPELH